MAITGDQLVALMVHLSWLSLLLLVGKLIRARLRFLQRLFLPASILGGFLGLALGPYVLGATGIQIMPPEMLTTWGALPGVLINVVFACLFLGLAIPGPASHLAGGGAAVLLWLDGGHGTVPGGNRLTVLLLAPLFGVPVSSAVCWRSGSPVDTARRQGCGKLFEELGFRGGLGSRADVRHDRHRFGGGFRHDHDQSGRSPRLYRSDHVAGQDPRGDAQRLDPRGQTAPRRGR
jgi:Na+/glutamate symporter